jgi:hypothetical protein
VGPNPDSFVASIISPMIPHLAHTTRGPNVGTGTSSGHGAASMTASWCHCSNARRCLSGTPAAP